MTIKRIAPVDFTPLRRVSPSQAQRLLDCPLRVVLRNTHGELLPPTAYTYFGTAVHELFQWAVRTGVREEAGLRRQFDELLEVQAQRCREAGLEALLPFRHNVKNYGLRYNAALRKAAGFPVTPEPEASTPGPAGEPAEQVEEWLHACSEKLVGKADLIRFREGRWELVDYKTGLLTDGDGAVKPEYVAQMKLYAHMMHETLGVFPEKIYLEPLAGEPLELPLSADECEAFAEQVVAVLTETNLLLRESDWSKLARPDTDRCRTCECRPACRPYQPDSGKERFGRIVELRQTGDRYAIFLDGNRRVVRVPAAEVGLLKPGQQIRFFLMKPAGANASEWLPGSYGFIESS